MDYLVPWNEKRQFLALFKLQSNLHVQPPNYSQNGAAIAGRLRELAVVSDHVRKVLWVFAYQSFFDKKEKWRNYFVDCKSLIHSAKILLDSFSFNV